MKVSMLACMMLCGSVSVFESSSAETNPQASKVVQPHLVAQADSAESAASQRTIEWTRLENRGYTPNEIKLISDARHAAEMAGELPTETLVNHWNSEHSSLRRQLGDSLLDALLYASHLPNRVEIISVEAGAGAAMAGFLPGDGILAYGGIRVFTRFDLGASVLRVTQSIGTTLSSKSVTVVIARDGNLFEGRVSPGMAALGVETRTMLRDPMKWTPKISPTQQRD